ncbi:TatD family deoxyribonuclease [Pseudactinotalea sp. HY160]|uniref:TatD family hydrolase n=1 Tax=Pseudactinotalea sp. HY160 TaxID=2654490 RepID=UPI00128DC161|nr:TatD family hydrolase [Pseudactinotalea sp. HY160]MPV48678.1 TatD family deoxyribonuclease [Pseudactinotalea sp. HY160]
MSRRPRPTGLPPAPEPLPGPVVDNHTHLESIAALLSDPADPKQPTDDAARPGIATHLAAALAVGVDRIVQIGCDLDSAAASLDIVDLARTNTGRGGSGESAAVVAGVAIHPNEVVAHHRIVEASPDGLEPARAPRHETGYADAFARIAELARDERIRVISETGLDHFRAGERGRAVQREAFRDHIALAKELGLPMQIHDREAHAAVLEVLDADGAPERTVVHAFSGDAAFARACLERGCHLSFSGTVTFKNAADLRAAARIVPADRLLVETDAPYLTPHPNRGRPNSPVQLPHTVRLLAELRGEDLSDFCERLAALSEDLYGPFA